MIDGSRAVINGTVAPTNFTLGTLYYVVNGTATTFQLSATPGGAASFSFADGHAEMHKWLDRTTIVYADSTDPNKDSGSAEQTAAQNNSIRDQSWGGSRFPTPNNP